MLAKNVVNRNELFFFTWYESMPKKIRVIEPKKNGSNLDVLGSYFVWFKNSFSIKLNKIGFMNTPILKARKQNKELVFYNDAEYETWKEIILDFDPSQSLN